MSKRPLSICIALVLFAAAFATQAQPPRKVPRVGFVPVISEPNANTESFRKALSDLGYVEGSNLVLESRWGDGNHVRDQVAELVRLKVDVIVVASSPAVRAATAATRSIPIVALDLETDPLAGGLVRSLSQPGGNLTGVFLDLPELSGKLLELMREVVPDRAAVLWDASVDPVPLRALEAAARSRRVPVDILPVRTPDEFAAAFRAATQGRAKSVVVLASPMMFAQRAQIASLAHGSRLPIIAQFREFAEAGGLMSYGPSIKDMFRRAAVLVDKILKGAKPGDLPVERPTEFGLVINMKSAKALGLTIPPSILVRADEIID